MLKIAHVLGLDIAKLKKFMNINVTKANVNEYGRFDNLSKTVDKGKAKVYFETLEGKSIPAFQLGIKIENLLKAFILSGGFDIDEPNR